MTSINNPISSFTQPSPAPSNVSADQTSTAAPPPGEAQGQSHTNATTLIAQRAALAKTQPSHVLTSPPKAAAESHVAAIGEAMKPMTKAQTEDEARGVTPDLAEDYPPKAARDRFIEEISSLNKPSRTGENLDLKVPLIDQIPDRPMPEIKPGRR